MEESELLSQGSEGILHLTLQTRGKSLLVSIYECQTAWKIGKHIHTLGQRKFQLGLDV